MQEKHSPPPGHTQSGNALFLILIAVALFAALAYAITSSSRGGGDINREQNVLLAAQIVQQAGALQSTVQRMLLTGTDAADLDFCDGADQQCGHIDPATHACDSGIDCVFAPEGGGAIAPSIPSAALTGVISPEYNRWVYMNQPSFSDIGTSAEDPVIMACGLTQQVCENINKGLGEATTPPAYNPLALAIFCFVPEGAGGPVDMAATCPGCNGARSLCVGSLGGLYVYYHYLAER